jgi:hypothetical protein
MEGEPSPPALPVPRCPAPQREFKGRGKGKEETAHTPPPDEGHSKGETKKGERESRAFVSSDLWAIAGRPVPSPVRCSPSPPSLSRRGLAVWISCAPFVLVGAPALNSSLPPP